MKVADAGCCQMGVNAFMQVDQIHLKHHLQHRFFITIFLAHPSPLSSPLLLNSLHCYVFDGSRSSRCFYSF
jgi:hypothetical protein